MATAINVETFGGFHRGRSDLDRLRANRYGQLEILVPTLARDLHFASAADAETDWNVPNPTHLTVYVHSETTPATDYISMYHDATSGFVNVASGTMLLQIDATTVVTVAAASVTFSQDVIISSGFGLNVGSATQVTISDGDGATNLIPEGQFLGVGTAFAGGAVVIATFNTTNDRTVSPKLAFVKGAAATQVATTAVANNEVVGSIIAYGSDSGDFETPVAAIEFVVDDVGAPGASAIGGSLEFYTTADAGSTLTLAFTINNDQNIYVANNNGVVIGHTAFLAPSATPEFQIIGTASGSDTAMLLAEYSADAGAPIIYMIKSRGGTVGTNTIVNDNDNVGEIGWFPADCAGITTRAAVFNAEVDDTTPAAGDIGMAFVWQQMPGAGGAIRETLRLAASGELILAAGATPASVGTTPGTPHEGAITATGGLGGNTSIGTTGVGGIGGGYSFTGGAGGTANSATTAATGGAGGAFVVTTGAGAAAAVAGVDSTGGASGAITLLSGDGGAVSLAVSGTATGGRAGVVTIQGGVGGAVTATTGTNVGGAGGDVSAIAGVGGAASGATDTGGRGGDVAITAGQGGSGDTGGRGGNVTITPGAVGAGGSPVVGAMLLAGGYVFQSSSATEIGIAVVNTALAVGTSGSLVIPYLSTTGAAFTDAIGGDVNGAIGVNYDSDTGPTSTFEVRSNGAWVSVAVSGYLMQNRVPWEKESTFLSHPNQVFEDEGRVWIDESLCYICGEKMTPGEQVTFWANGPTERGVHAIFGHVHAERNDYIRGLEARIIELEQKLLVPVFA